MKLLTLRLRGAIGIREGLGLEEINIDFREFSSGLIALIGENGAGKTTVIENLTPFRSLRSRPGGLARQFCLKDSCRDLLLSIGDDEYRFLIEMNPTLKTPAIKSYVYKNGGCLNPDGNAEGYDVIVTKLFGDADLFFSSLFMPQRRLPFSKIDGAKRKDLLLELFGAGHLQAKYDYANQSAKSVREDIANKNGEIEALARSTRSLDAIDSDIDLCQKALDADRLKIVGLDTEITQHKADLDIYQAKQTAQAVAQSKLSQAKSRLTSLNTEHLSIQDSTVQKGRQLKIFIDTDQQEIDRLFPQCSLEDEVAIDGCISMAEQAKADYQATLEARQQYSNLVAKHVEAKRALEIAEANYDIERHRLQAILTAAQTDYHQVESRAEFTRKQLAEEITRKTRSTQILQTVPCQDETIPIECREQCKSCQFLKDANDAILQIAGLSTKLTEAEAAWTAASKELKGKIGLAQQAIDAQPNWEIACVPLEIAIDTAWNDLRALGFDLTASQTIQRKHDECEKADYPGQKRKIREIRAKVENLMQKVSENRARLEELQNESINKLTDLKLQIDSVKGEISALEPQIEFTLELRLRDLREALKKVETIKLSTASDVAKGEANIARLTEDKTRAGQSIEELQVAKVQLAEAQADLADWDHLAQSLSRTGGFQSMLVESAGAEMTPFANELLVLYGRPWTIEISTCRPSADGKKMVDGFFVTVNTPNGPRELSDLSGGEEVIVDQVIYDSIANMLRRQSGLLLQTAIKDESDGSLDGDRAIDYVKAVEAAHHVSGMHHTLLISHRESIQDLIPNRIRFVKGQGIILEAA